MAPRRYKSVDECRPEIRQYIGHIEATTDDDDDELKTSGSTTRYKQDLRWLDDWIDRQEERESEEGEKEVTITVSDIDSPTAMKIGHDLSSEFNGTTGRYRWDRISTMWDWFVRAKIATNNPFDEWDAVDDFGLTKSTQQSKEMEEGEKYAVSPEEVELMLKHPGRYQTRNSLCIRLLWQTGMRRGEVAHLKIDDIDRGSQEITLPASITKNKKKRIVAYQTSLKGHLSDWLDGGLRDEMMGGRDHDYLFCGERGGRLRSESINEIVRESAKRAGINRKLDYEPANGGARWKITAHSLRHGYATWMINETDAGLWETSQQLGHSSVDITEKRYVDHDPRAGIEHAKKYGPD